jgi:hypothetical protein
MFFEGFVFVCLSIFLFTTEIVFTKALCILSPFAKRNVDGKKKESKE